MVVLNACDNLPQGMLETYSDVTLAIDIMYINKIPFVITTSREIHFCTAVMIKINQIYTTNNQHITRQRIPKNTKLRERQFECIRKTMELQGIITNIIGRDEHVPELER